MTVEAIIVAAIGALALVIVAVIQVMGQRAVRLRLGETNGRGTIVEMSELSLDALSRVEADLRAYREDSGSEIAAIRGSVGGLMIDLAGLRQLRMEMDRLVARMSLLEARMSSYDHIVMYSEHDLKENP